MGAFARRASCWRGPRGVARAQRAEGGGGEVGGRSTRLPRQVVVSGELDLAASGRWRELDTRPSTQRPKEGSEGGECGCGSRPSVPPAVLAPSRRRPSPARFAFPLVQPRPLHHSVSLCTSLVHRPGTSLPSPTHSHLAPPPRSPSKSRPPQASLPATSPYAPLARTHARAQSRSNRHTHARGARRERVGGRT